MLLELFEMVARSEITSLQASQELEKLIKREFETGIIPCECQGTYVVGDFIEGIEDDFRLN